MVDPHAPKRPLATPNRAGASRDGLGRPQTRVSYPRASRPDRPAPRTQTANPAHPKTHAPHPLPAATGAAAGAALVEWTHLRRRLRCLSRRRTLPSPPGTDRMIG
ncbi:hypothetical protein GCM10010462_17550 [Microbacterium dextranolyticum]